MPQQTSVREEAPRVSLTNSVLSPRLHLHGKLTSRYLPGEREVWVYLPPGYEEESNRRFPLLLLQDGQNLFEHNSVAPAAVPVPRPTWHVAGTADAAITAGEVEPLVIAGVAHAEERRLAEYTPSCDWKMGGGEARQYGEMLTQELLPFLHSRYRIRSGPQHTGLGGSSLGGLFSLWLGLRHPEIFGKLAVLSPSVWWNHHYILRYVQELTPQRRGQPRIWLDVGDAEGRRTVTDTVLLAARLRAHGWRDGAELHFECVAEGTHDEAAWAERVQPMLRFLFPTRAGGDRP